MNKSLKRFDYLSVLKYVFLTALYLLFASIGKQTAPYSTCVLTASLYLGNSLFFSCFFYILSFLILGQSELLLPALITSLFFVLVKILHKKERGNLKFNYIAFSLLSLIGFLLVETPSFTQSSKTIIILLTVLLTYFSLTAGKAITQKGLKVKLDYEELLSIFALTIFLGLGVCNLLSPYVWKGITIFTILLACYLLRIGLGTFVSVAFGISFAIYYGNVEYVASTLLLGFIADGLNGISRYASSISILAVDYLVQLFFNIYGSYQLSDFLPPLISVILFIVIPNEPLNKLKERLYAFREKQLVRQSINRNRTMLSNRLYELSGVFNEISSAFYAFNERAMTEDKIKPLLKKQILSLVCEHCSNYQNCVQFNEEYEHALEKMIDIGFAKGKLSLIDFPNLLGDCCIRPNEIIYGLNKNLADYRAYERNYQNVINGRKMLADEANGVSEILRGLALESGSILKYQSRLERELNSKLMKNGILANEILIYGEANSLAVSMIISMKEFAISNLIDTISEVVGFEMTLSEKSNVNEDKTYLLFKKAKEYEAVFGLAKTTKNGSSISGDTHSFIKINDDKLLIALSDGMGSGEYAEAFSSVSLSLIESFYRAGMNSELILNTVNKLLSVNTEDSFTALDVSVIDLNSLTVDFVKYGAPYGFIINEGSVKIVEGSTLPLGIIDDLKPSVCHTELNDGDIILLVTDGISDAFGSSGEMVDYLRKSPSYNPQSLSDGILKKALEFTNNERKDDMTAVAVRVYKKLKNGA